MYKKEGKFISYITFTLEIYCYMQIDIEFKLYLVFIEKQNFGKSHYLLAHITRITITLRHSKFFQKFHH